MKQFTLLISISLFTLLITSAKEKHGKSYKKALKTLEGFCAFVPSGNAVIDGDTISVQSFYMSSTEITNIQYLEFLASLRREGKWDELKIALIDSSKWSTPTSQNSKYEEFYHRHPAYRDYPVVNVSKEGAELFCKWLSKAYDSISNGELKLNFRIPTKAEYVRAARGDHHEYVYPWGGSHLRNTAGQALCNFVRLDETNITRSPEGYRVVLFPNYTMAGVFDVLAPGKSYWPNEFELYNLSGNAAEMISDGDLVVGGDWRCPGYDVRIESEQNYNGPAPTIGFRVVASFVN